MSYQINDLLNLMVDQSASDLHLHVGRAPVLRINGEVISVEGANLQPMDTENLMKAITSAECQEQLRDRGGCDFSMTHVDKTRFRVNVFRTKNCYGMVLRQIPKNIPPLDEIGFPDMIKDLSKRLSGLILVTGPTGCGKSTTLASIVDWMNSNRNSHVITIEDPIEYLHKHRNCIVTQREIGSDVPSFAEAVRGALRQDPDVILVGEMRDLETIEAALTAAETGHLVLGTLHTSGSVQSIDRIIDAFPSHAKNQIRSQLATVIVAVISQVLCSPRVSGKRLTAYEIMVNTIPIAQLIRESKTHRIMSDIETGTNHGMISLNACLLNLYHRKLITAEEALLKSYFPVLMQEELSKSPLPPDESN